MHINVIETRVEKAILALEEAGKTDYIGESVSQLEHALQCAFFAEKEGHSDAVILASLFHDIGHFAHGTQQAQMAELGVVYHEWIGAKLIVDFGFSSKVALLIGYHVDAKRYLAGKKPSYYERLSNASKGTLAFQGGPMSQSEMNEFEAHPLYKDILQVRVNDEKGKELGLDIPDLNYYRNRIRRHIESNVKVNLQMEKIDPLTDFIDNQWVLNFKRQLEADLVNANK